MAMSCEANDPPGRMVAAPFDRAAGEDRPSDTRRSESFPLITRAEPPRTWRLALCAGW